MKTKRDKIYCKYIKRIMDIVISSMFLVILSPIFILIALMVRINLGKPIIFRQNRPGRDGKIFKLLKFRSMTNKKDSNGILLPDQQRMTRFGKLLRSTSLDELPELINIIKGDMSIVGPRPLLVDYLNYYNEKDAQRHSVRPGLTGLAQISGRNSLTWELRFKKDIEYVNTICLKKDLKIVFLTLKKIFLREGIEFNCSENIYDYFELSHKKSKE